MSPLKRAGGAAARGGDGGGAGGALLLGGIARGIGKGGREQRAADLGALAGARAMREAYTRLFEPPSFAGRANPRHLEVGPYKDPGRQEALGVARADGARNVEVRFPGRWSTSTRSRPPRRARSVMLSPRRTPPAWTVDRAPESER
jgi:hypothetical protein